MLDQRTRAEILAAIDRMAPADQQRVLAYIRELAQRQAAEERQQRRRAIASAIGSARLEGLEPDQVLLKQIDRYIAGEITLEALIDENIKLLKQTSK